MSYRNISLSDLIGLKEYDGTIESRNKLLYALGMDTSEEIETVVCEHRTLSGSVQTCEYYMGFERKDKAWLKSGYASIEAVIASSDDPYKRRMIRELHCQGYQGALNEGGEG